MLDQLCQLKIYSARNDRPVTEYEMLLLTVQEKEKAAMFKFAKDRLAYINSRCFLRFLLAGELQVPVEQLVLCENPWGKPFIANQHRFHFNLSHSHGMTLVALANKPVGVDVESVSGHTYWRSLLPSVCMEKERCFSNTKQDFIQLWTQKEAVLKSHGKGLSVDPLSIGPISPHNSDWQTIRCEGKPYQVRVLSLEKEGYLASVAVADSGMLQKPTNEMLRTSEGICTETYCFDRSCHMFARHDQ